VFIRRIFNINKLIIWILKLVHFPHFSISGTRQDVSIRRLSLTQSTSA